MSPADLAAALAAARAASGTSASPSGWARWAQSQARHPFAQYRPGSLPPRNEVPHQVVHLEDGRDGAPRMLTSSRHPGQRCAQRLQHPCHQAERGSGEHVELLIGLLGVGEEPRQHLQQRLVAEREQLGDLARGGITDQQLRGGDVEGLAGKRGQDGPGRLERRILPPQLAELLPDPQEPAVARGAPVTACALALLD